MALCAASGSSMVSSVGAATFAARAKKRERARRAAPRSPSGDCAPGSPAASDGLWASSARGRGLPPGRRGARFRCRRRCAAAIAAASVRTESARRSPGPGRIARTVAVAASVVAAARRRQTPARGSGPAPPRPPAGCPAGGGDDNAGLLRAARLTRDKTLRAVAHRPHLPTTSISCCRARRLTGSRRAPATSFAEYTTPPTAFLLGPEVFAVSAVRVRF